MSGLNRINPLAAKILLIALLTLVLLVPLACVESLIAERAKPSLAGNLGRCDGRGRQRVAQIGHIRRPDIHGLIAHRRVDLR
jgi:hypothetical protein